MNLGLQKRRNEKDSRKIVLNTQIRKQKRETQIEIDNLYPNL